MGSERSKGWWWRGARAADGASRTNAHFQAAPEIRCWHQKMTSGWNCDPHIILFRRFPSCLGSPEVNAMPSLWLGRYFTEPWRWRWAGMAISPPGSSPPVPVFAMLVGAQGTPCSTTCCQLSLEAPFGHWVTGNITTDLGDLSCHCSCNQGWYENMKINNSFILLFSGRQAFLFITLFIVGCYKYSRIIIPR